MKAYRGLVYETPGFVDYFYAATPIAEIAELNIGSRPASRKATRRIEDLRAIPWSFSWGQARVALPGWFGFGAAVEGFLREDTQARKILLRRMCEEWPFFAALLSNMDMVLAKADLEIARRYAELVPDRARGRADLSGDRGGMEAHRRGAGDRDRTDANGSPTIRRWRARSPIASPISRRSTTSRRSCCAAGARGRSTTRRGSVF